MVQIKSPNISYIYVHIIGGRSTITVESRVLLEVLDEEVFEEAQFEGLTSRDCVQQGQECLRTQILQHCREWG
ncbi:hypothetical protein Dsin_029139 [Dipteronia sinensis]|uniref:Uncharacterized protein n=1 Tax=Dipteronia sinensis TaxID=43782 RepID=A0AAE0DUW7_9ROSI|nr:hypothetical protein Dsin_029139 [Dipteronia sinensis]